MKRSIPLAAALAFSIFHVALAGPDSAPGIDKEVKQLEEKIKTDLASGSLSQGDADELNLKLDRLKHMEDSAEREGRITPRTRRDMRQDLDKVTADLTRKEEQQKAAKASAAGSPS